MRLKYLLFLLIFSCKSVLAQEVPHKINFAGMELKLTKEAIKDIQADVDALTRSEKYFQIKLERVDMYMPIIERIFREEGLPQDFKYLVIQESALISDAVSSSNAVGFWQFKEISALENDLRIDRYVDERMNIVSASRAAANYLKNHNKTFNNWAHSLIAYQRGVVGAKDVIDTRYEGANKMPITKNTYWYLKKYLAHKVAFEAALGTSQPTYFLLEDSKVNDLSIADIANKHNVPTELVEEYNKWLKRGRVPTDKTYTAIIPLTERPNATPFQSKKQATVHQTPAYDNSAFVNQPILIEGQKPTKNATIAHELKVNGLKAIVAANGYTVASLAEKAGLSEKKFRRLNDMSMNQKLEIGEIYYTQRKLNRAKYYYHTVYPNESMWDISQKYGLKLHKLYRKNRMKDPTTPKVGRVLWLRLNRPRTVDVEYKEVQYQKSPEVKDKIKKDTLTIEIKPSPKDSTKSVSTVDSISLQKSKEQDVKLDSLNTEQETVSDSTKSISKVYNENITDKELVVENKLIEAKEEDNTTNVSLMSYTIKKGDTFFSIANKFNMKISDLLSVNNLSIKQPLAIGQEIQVNKVEAYQSTNVSPEKESETANTEHTVKAGETLYAISRNYKVSVEDLMKWNNKSDYSLKEGEIILIKGK